MAKKIKSAPLEKSRNVPESKSGIVIGDENKTGLAHYERTSSTLLGQQPSDLRLQKDNKANPEWQVLRSHLETLIVMLRSWRESWWTQNWSDLAEFILPRRSIWLTQSTGGLPSPNNMTRGKPINTAIVDPTATQAARICSGGLMSGLASPSRPWFKVMPAIKNFNIDAEARKWLDETENRIYSVLAGSNFYNAFAQECEDLVVFGTAPCIIYEDDEDIIRCYNPCVGEYYLSSGARMKVDGLYRQFVMTIQQIVDFFGVENCPPEVITLWNQKGSSLATEKIIAHSIEPNFGIGPNEAGKIPGNFAWRETYWVYGSASNNPLSLRGFVDQPFTAARWATQSNDAYGRSPGMDVLPDVMQLQVETRRKAEAIEKQVRPPLIASMDLKNQPSSILPGHVTYANMTGPGTGMRPIYEVMPDIRGMMEDLREIQGRIQKGFFNDIFAMFSEIPQGKMTAYEASQRVNEMINRVGQVVENLMSESLKPKLKRIFGILKRRGFIDPPPDSLHGIPLEVQFVSMLALASKAAATGGVERISSYIGNLVAVFPEAKNYLNVGNSIMEMNELLGNAQKLLNGPDEIAQLEQAQAQQQAAVQKMQAAQHMAQTANIGAQAAQTLAATNVGSGQTALNQLMGAGGGGQ